jgi:hypothetical protein
MMQIADCFRPAISNGMNGKPICPLAEQVDHFRAGELASASAL